jgi:hypothetical protein
MADHQNGGETIRQMLAGFNTMQMQLGLLPMQSSQTPMGVGFQPPPPPPQIPHPSQAAAMAMAQQQAMTQQTLQAAQMTRYIPPPSTPIGGGGGFQSMNPYLAGAMGSGMHGMPSPMTMTAPAFGGYRPGGAFGSTHIGQGHIPPIFNPFAPSVQPSHFMTPAMQNLQIMQGVQARGAGMAAGAVDAGFRFGGAGIGALAGSAFGPLGTLAGGFLGHTIGGFLGGMATGPGSADAMRGRQLQNMSAPWMVSGGILNPFTGQGMDREAGRATATGLRHLATRDHDFGRTGFNTEDVMRITQLSSDQGLLTTARSPDDITRKVKEISKAVKTLVQITGDPDVRNAIASLGQMKDLGFVGTAGQAGAVANRAMFARMAGVSQGAMNDIYGMPGAMMAQQSGLAGATGYMAGMTGGAAANIARSSGALDSLQMARAGGVQGLGQINAMAQLSSMNQDIYMAAALKKGKGGIDIDIDTYRKAQSMSISEVSNLAANNMRDLGKEGIFELRTRKQEFKDKLAQQMSPFEMQMNVVRQAQGLQKSVPGMNIGSALFATARSNAVGAGMGDEQAEAAARSLELQFTSRAHWDGQIQQLKAQRRQLAGSEKAKWDQFRTPGLGTRMSRGIDGFFNDVSDSLSSPFRSLSQRMERASEEEAAAASGERIMRFGSSTLARTPQEQAMVLRTLRTNAAFRGGADGASSLDAGGLDRMGNRISSFFGLSSTSDANRINEIASKTQGTAFGLHPLGSFGDARSAMRRVQDVSEVARAVDTGTSMSDAQRADTMRALEKGSKGINVAKMVFQASSKLHARAPTAGIIVDAGAMSGTQMRASIIETLTKDNGWSQKDAETYYEANKESLQAMMAKGLMSWGDSDVKETIGKSKDAQTALGGVSGARSRSSVANEVKRLGAMTGLVPGESRGLTQAMMNKVSGLNVKHSEGDLDLLKGVVNKTDKDVLEMAALMSAKNSDRGQKGIAELMDKVGGTESARLQGAAEKLLATSDPKIARMLNRVVGAGGGDLKDIQGRVGALDDLFAVRMTESSQKFAMQKLADASGNKEVANMDPLEGLKQISDERIMGDARLGSKAQRQLLIKAKQEGSADLLNQWISQTGPQGEKELLGGGEGGALRSLDERIAEMQQLRDEVSVEGGDKATQLFAEGSTMLASAAKDLKEATENIRISQNSHWWQGKHGGG